MDRQNLADKNFIKHASILKKILEKENIEFNEPPIKATYNGPFTLPNLRRNEAMYLIQWENQQTNNIEWHLDFKYALDI